MYTDTPLYIWQAADWPHWRYDLNALAAPLAEVSHAQGVLLGRLADVGMDWRERASLAALTDEVLHTSAIERTDMTLSVASRVIIFPFVAGHSSWQES